MSGTKPEKSHKIAIPLIIIAALIGAGIGAATGISVLYIIGMVGLIIALGAAMLASRKDKRKAEKHSRSAEDHRPS